MKPETITVASKIDAKTFYKFAVFDTLSLRKRWISPAIFAGILLTCSMICFSMQSKAEQAGLLGTVLLIVALGVPGIYFGTFFYSLKTQSKTMKLQTPKLTYTVILDRRGIHVISAKPDGGNVAYNWEQLFRAYKKPGCIYLYVSARQAFLLPETCTDASFEELWELISSHLPANQVYG